MKAKHTPGLAYVEGSKETVEANGKLIAAAPDLLAALQVCEASFRLRVRQGETVVGLSLEAWQNVQAAIAKAEGHE